MNRYFGHISVLLVVSAFGIASCEKEKPLPNEPVISDLYFDKVSKELSFRFTDGDGNYGLSQSDTVPPFQPWEDPGQTIPNRFHTNLWLDYFEKRNGEWVLIETPSTIDFRIPVLTPSGQNKQLRVRVTYDMSSFVPFAIAQSDTIKFAVRIVDRDLNISNTLETEALYLPN